MNNKFMKYTDLSVKILDWDNGENITRKLV